MINHAVESTQLSASELGDQVTRLRDVSGDILGSVSDVVKRFEEQSASLTTASHNLAEVNRQIETNVQERRPELESLTANLRSRSEELDSLMKSFTRIIAETLKTAEERATAVSRMLSENTATATKGVVENFEAMNRTAGTESRKAAEAVREANKALIAEMGHAIGEATKRFAEATREMRQATQDLQRDLTNTREELKRGVLELPEEARENAEAMRRVVGDQIKALSELSEIVSRHGKTLDLSSPSLGEPHMRSLPQPAAAVGGGEAAAIPASGEGTGAPPPPTIRIAGDATRRAASANGAAPPTAMPKPMVARVQPQPRPAPTPASPHQPAQPAQPSPRSTFSMSDDRASGGWVSDLLRRASDSEAAATQPKEPAAAAPPPPAASQAPVASQATVSAPLNALSGDIARAIDHNAAVDLWERHSRGERNLFTRRLYTLQGQQTFDEIRKKYQRDQEFRGAVDRYVNDFEKLLAEVTKNGKDKTSGRAYLTSDTGKVYTMLAHASGRLD